MPYSDVDIINQGLGKFSSSKITRITPAQSSLEKHCAGYVQWKESELAKRRWVFATDFEYDLPQVANPSGKPKTYKYTLPDTVMRPIRGKQSDWQQSGRFVFSDAEDLTIPVVLKVAEAQFDPLFVDVLACRVWLECVAFVTGSTGAGLDRAKEAYNAAVAEAAKSNAFVIGPEDLNDDETAFDFLTGRW